MRRALATLVALGTGALALMGAGGERSDTYRVDAIFDNTAGLIPGQDVKIAGARVGSVSEVHLTPDRRARVQMEIEPGFAPFRADADCVIRPQSLIGEKFVQCDPGTPDARPLARRGEAPTVPLDRTHSPVDLDLVFAALRRPYRERLAILVNELGTGLAGRPAELSEAIRRANPALQETREVLRLLDQDREALGRLIERSDTVLAELGRRDRSVARFIERADTATKAVAARSDELSEGVRLLPELLGELQPAARRLARVSSDAAPLLRDLRASAGPVRAVLADLGPLADSARPALVRLGEMSEVGRRAVRKTRPVAAALRPVADRLPPIAAIAADLNESLRDTGTVEGFQTFVYYAALATSRFDRISHILPSYQVTGSCQQYAEKPAPGCSAHWKGSAAADIDEDALPARTRRGAQAEKDRPGLQQGERTPDTGRPNGDRRPETGDPNPRLPELPSAPALPELPILDYLLGQ